MADSKCVKDFCIFRFMENWLFPKHLSICKMVSHFHFFPHFYYRFNNNHKFNIYLFVYVFIYLCFRSIIPSFPPFPCSCLLIFTSLQLQFPLIPLFSCRLSLFPFLVNSPFIWDIPCIDKLLHPHHSFRFQLHHSSFHSKFTLFVCLVHIIAPEFITYSCLNSMFALSIPSSCSWLAIFTLTSRFVSWLFRKIFSNRNLMSWDFRQL